MTNLNFNIPPVATINGVQTIVTWLSTQIYFMFDPGPNGELGVWYQLFTEATITIYFTTPGGQRQTTRRIITSGGDNP